MNNADFWTDGWFINDFHRKNSMAAQREVQQILLYPCSREQKLAQIARIRQHSAIPKRVPTIIPHIYLSNMNDKNVIRSNK